MTKTSTNTENQGVYFDLTALFASLNQRFFDNKISAQIKWGQRRKVMGLKKRSLKMGSYHPYDRSIIINPCLDQAIVPKICVERILFHEMAHQKFPVKKGKNGKNIIHYREFYDFEKNYPYLEQADLWIKANLDRLLRF